MAVTRLEAPKLAGLPVPAGADRGEWCDDLVRSLRCRKSGRTGEISFSIVYRVRGKKGQLRKTYPPGTSLAEARRKARTDLALAADGVDPSRPVAPKSPDSTIEGLWSVYREIRIGSGMKSIPRLDAYLKVNIFKKYGGWHPADFGRRNMLSVVEECERRGAATVAVKLLGAVRPFYDWIIFRRPGLGVEENPAFRIPVELPPKKRAGRALSSRELGAVLCGLLARVETDGWAQVLLTRLMSAQRTAEVLKMKDGEHLDIPSRWWHIPETKTNLPHHVPLPSIWWELVYPHALALRGALDPASPYLFTSPKKRSAPRCATNVPAAAVRFSRAFGIHFRPHDFRRTCITLWSQEVKIPRETRKLLVNHVDGKDRTHMLYEYGDYREVKEAGMAQWDAFLRELLEEAREPGGIPPGGEGYRTGYLPVGVPALTRGAAAEG